MSEAENERKAFLLGIEEDPYDLVVRKIFADWLEQHDELEEADKQRNWTEEKQKALEYLDEFGSEVDMTGEALLEAALVYQRTGEMVCRGEYHPDIVYEGREKLWEAVSTLTGEEIPEEKRNSFFRCAC